MSTQAAHRVTAWLLCAAALGLCGCARVGRSLVDHFDSSDAGLPLLGSCLEAPQCGDAGPPVAAFAGEPLQELDLLGCGGCPVPNPGDLGVGLAADADAGVDAEPGCDAPTADAPAALEDGADWSCAGQRLDLDLAEPSLRLRELRLRQVALHLTASRPREVILEAAHLEAVVFDLEGPVTLLVEAPRVLQDVQVRGTARTSAAPSLQIVQNEAAALRVGSPAEPFAGRVSLARIAVIDSQIVAHTVNLESMTFYDGLIDASVVSTADCDLDTVELRVGDAQFAAGRMRRVQVTRCERMQLLGVDSKDAQYGPCSAGPLRVYDSSVIGGVFDGAIETDLTDYFRVRFGAREPTELTLWSGLLQASAFCGHAERALFGGGANCVTCEPELFVEPDSLCNPKAPAKYTGNYCEALWDVPMCQAPPERPRPPHGRNDAERLLELIGGSPEAFGFETPGVP